MSPARPITPPASERFPRSGGPPPAAASQASGSGLKRGFFAPKPPVASHPPRRQAASAPSKHSIFSGDVRERPHPKPVSVPTAQPAQKAQASETPEQTSPQKPRATDLPVRSRQAQIPQAVPERRVHFQEPVPPQRPEASPAEPKRVSRFKAQLWASSSSDEECSELDEE